MWAHSAVPFLGAREIGRGAVEIGGAPARVVPARGRDEQLGCRSGIVGFDFGPEDVAHQRVVADQVSSPSSSNSPSTGASSCMRPSRLHISDTSSRPVRTAASRGREPIGNGGDAQELAHRLGLRAQDLGPAIRPPRVVEAGGLQRGAVLVPGVARGGQRELDRGGPAFGAHPEALDIVGGEGAFEAAVEEVADGVAIERQIGGPQVGDVVARLAAGRSRPGTACRHASSRRSGRGAARARSGRRPRRGGRARGCRGLRARTGSRGAAFTCSETAASWWATVRPATRRRRRRRG